MMKRRQNVFAINWMEVEALTKAKHDNPHHILGIHECIDDVFLSIWNNIDSFDSSKNTLKNWIAAISQYRAIDYKRKYLRLLNEEVDISQVENQLYLNNIINEDELRSDIEELLCCLKQEDKDVFIKRYIEGKSMKEVALETGIKEEVIYNRISRGRKKLRRKYRNATIE